jgi:hypothetical protein
LIDDRKLFWAPRFAQFDGLLVLGIFEGHVSIRFFVPLLEKLNQLNQI